MSENFKFGETVEGFDIPVLNEREIRAAAGLMFLATFMSLMQIIYNANFAPIKYVITIFLLDFFIRLFINPLFSPILIIGRFIVNNQTPEYVGAQQKKFAWYIGLVLSAAMFTSFVIFNAFSMITGITCLICLILMFFETAFGICLGCKIYSIFNKNVQYCPGEICDSKARKEIQKTSKIQKLIVFNFILFIIMLLLLFHEQFKQKPGDLFGDSASKEITEIKS